MAIISAAISTAGNKSRRRLSLPGRCLEQMSLIDTNRWLQKVWHRSSRVSLYQEGSMVRSDQHYTCVFSRVFIGDLVILFYALVFFDRDRGWEGGGGRGRDNGGGIKIKITTKKKGERERERERERNISS